MECCNVYFKNLGYFSTTTTRKSRLKMNKKNMFVSFILIKNQFYLLDF